MYDRILTEARSTVWLICPGKLDAIFDLLESRAAGVSADAETLRAFAEDNQRRRQIEVHWASDGKPVVYSLEQFTAAATTRQQPREVKALGIIPILGTIVQRGNIFTEASGTASTDKLSRQFDTLMANEQVGTILADIDSPGGTVYGVPELAHKIQSLRGRGKPLVAHVNAEAGSAAYWLASAFDEVVITPSGAAGSIGAYAVHTDQSELNAAMGVKRRYVAYGKHKTEGNPDEPLSDETAAELQARVDKYGLMFEKAIAANRGVPLATVQADWGQGRMLDADRAKAVGMVDKIESFEQTVHRLTTPRARVTSRLAYAKRWLET
jgi:signal peptide peptidase SppA